MGDETYSKFIKEELILRDHLAIDRTILANERTFLAYVRTALTLFIGGATFIRFFDSLILDVVGWVFVPLGALVFLLGYINYRKQQNLLKKIRVQEDNLEKGQP